MSSAMTVTATPTTSTTPSLSDLIVAWFTERCWTEGEYLLFANDRNAILELSDGKVVLQEVPTPRHQATVVKLTQTLGQSAHGRVLVAPMPVRLWAGKMREPDVTFYRTEHLDRLHDQHADPPDLVIEVLSPSTRDVDLGEKRVEYARAGIPEYWVVDLEDRVIVVHRLGERGYGVSARYGAGERLVPAAALDVVVEPDDLW